MTFLQNAIKIKNCSAHKQVGEKTFWPYIFSLYYDQVKKSQWENTCSKLAIEPVCWCCSSFFIIIFEHFSPSRHKMQIEGIKDVQRMPWMSSDNRISHLDIKLWLREIYVLHKLKVSGVILKNATRNVHKEERKCWRRSVRYECIFKFFINYVFTILCSFFSFGKLLFKVSFPVFLLISPYY